MIFYSLSLVSLISITWALAAGIVWWWFREGRRFPPGPRPWPVIGNLNLLGKIPHRSLHKLSKTYESLMHLQFGSYNVVVANSPDMAKEFLKTHDSLFASRPQLAVGKYLTYNFSNLVWGSYGPHWRQGRKIFLTHLFSSKKLELYEYIRVEETKDFLTRLHGSRGQQIHIRDHLYRRNLSVIMRIVLGKKYFNDDSYQPSESSSAESIRTLGELQEMFDEFLILNGAFLIGDWIPWLAWLDLQGYVKRMKILRGKFDKFFDFVIKDHHQLARAGTGDHKERAKDMMDIILDLLDDSDIDVKLNIDSVKGFTLDLLSGGTDTSATTVEWAMAELMKNPEKIKKATQELDKVIGQERWVEEKDMPNLPYLDAIMKETMRLHPAATFLGQRLAMEDCQVKQYHISKGTLVLINIWSMGRDPTLWDSPEEFLPERFLNKAIDIKGHNFELLPFGSGRRICPGYTLGLKMIQSSLANLLHGFNWILPGQMSPQDLDMEDIYGITSPMKHPLVAVVQPRLPPRLYT
ncbi:unnamed protein product [Rhodiola kirilowii]